MVLQKNNQMGHDSVTLIHLLSRGLVRNNDLQVPLLNTELTKQRVPLSKSQNFVGSAEPMEPVLTSRLLRIYGGTGHCIVVMSKLKFQIIFQRHYKSK